MAIQVIGIPRGLMLYRDGILWKNFLKIWDINVQSAKK